MIHAGLAATALLLFGSSTYADISGTSASLRPDNSLIVDIQITTGGNVAQAVVTYQTVGVDPLVSRLTPASGSRANSILSS
jgi:hypothetical protein